MASGERATDTAALIQWLRNVLASYDLEPYAVFRQRGEHDWPFTASNQRDLLRKLKDGGHFLPLPKEPASLANILEVSLVDFVMDEVAKASDVHGARGSERGYPDVELSGPRFGSGFHALDVKVAQRSKSRRQTQSRITLYTGNTYFRYPKLKWPGGIRRFADYDSHLVLLALYTLNEDSVSRIDELELLVHESWRVASSKRSSTTREYIGAVQNIDALREGRGEFRDAAAFYSYWRGFPFQIGKAVQKQLDRLLKDQS